MAHLLGSKACIDSLRVDVEDLQNVVHDIIGKTGSIKCHSWKFPDKIATDIDINELLQRYQFGKNEIDNQVSHIVLFEIIIDRLLLVLHGSWRYLHEIQSKILPQTMDSTSTVNQHTSLSVGLVVKKYWNKLLHLSTALQQHENDRKRIQTAPPIPRTKSNQNLEKRCQTLDISCQICPKYQQSLRDQTDNLINLCQTYNLPSSLAQQRCSFNDKFAVEDLNHYSDCQSKDLDRLSKHLEYLHNTLNKTKADLQLNENRCKNKDETNRRLQQLVNDDKQSKKILQEFHDKKINDLKQEFEQKDKRLQGQIQSLTNQKSQLEQQLKQVNDLVVEQKEQIEKFEVSNTELRNLIQDRFKTDDLLKTLEQDRIRLQTELDLVKRDLDERNRDLQKERTRIENMIRQEQNYQTKQKELSTSYDELLQECDSLKKQVNELENARCEFDKQKSSSLVETHQIRSLVESNKQFKDEISSLKSNIEQLERQIQQMDEREQFLLHYPDLNGPIEHEQTTNNIIVDMQNQIRTNEIRIDLLKKQSQSLKISLEKCLAMNQTNSQPKSTTPSPLWLLNNEILEQQTPIFPLPQANLESERSMNSRDLIITPESRPPTCRNGRTSSIPPPSEYEMIIGKGRTTSRPSSAIKQRRDSSARSTKPQRANTTTSLHQCANCNKSYDDKKNFDIHKLYCRI